MTETFRLQAEGKAWGINYLDFRDYEPPEERPADEIVAQVVASAGITLKG